ncbi:hypothetical protein [Couchioplanes azureus]|uniref:hypothetical protein n=1 Tax=Couchioplanes caeruleus TaxID=56438 RepID=UPI0016713B9B|nr:hypothetical protein [Couchioplanes caeruleus]
MFSAEYNRAAATVDKQLCGSAPSRPQLHRWLSGTLTRLPHPDHCRVLEAMFPEWTARQLFEPYAPEDEPASFSDDRPAVPSQRGNDRDTVVIPQPLDEAPWVQIAVRDALDAAVNIEAKYAGTMATVLCRKIMDDCLDQLRDLQRGHFEAPFDDNWLVYALTERTKDRLLATSVEEVDLKWWQSAAGHTYWRLHREALARGIRVQRIFIYRDWTDDHETLARRQRDAGVRTLRVQRDQLSADLRVDMILWDDVCGYQSRVNSSGEAITNNYTFDKYDLNQMLDQYKIIESCAEEWPLNHSSEVVTND